MASTYLLALDFTDYLVNTLPITLLEYLAAAVATAYYLQLDQKDRPTLWLVRFLWLTAILETLANYAPIGYFSDYTVFGFVKDSPFQYNYWMYNIFILITVLFYTYYFAAQLANRQWRKWLHLAAVVYILFSVVNLLGSSGFFEQYNTISFLSGSLLIFGGIGAFFADMLLTDRKLDLKRHLPFYIAIGALLFYLSMAPLTIYSKYFTEEHANFVSFQAQVLIIANVFMYLTFITGSLICKTKSSY